MEQGARTQGDLRFLPMRGIFEMALLCAWLPSCVLSQHQ